MYRLAVIVLVGILATFGPSARADGSSGVSAPRPAVAPDPGHLLSTTDDARAVAIADRHPGVLVEPDPEAALVVTGPQADVSAYVADLVRADVELLGFTRTRTPLEALFFMLTDDAPEAVR